MRTRYRLDGGDDQRAGAPALNPREGRESFFRLCSPPCILAAPPEGVQTMRNVLFAAATIGLAAVVPIPQAYGQALQITEIRVDQPGADNDEYFEITGAPGAVLNDIFYIVIGDAPGQVPPNQNGTIETV